MLISEYIDETTRFIVSGMNREKMVLQRKKKKLGIFVDKRKNGKCKCICESVITSFGIHTPFRLNDKLKITAL